MSDRGNYSTRTVIEHMYEVSSDPSGDSRWLTYLSGLGYDVTEDCSDCNGVGGSPLDGPCPSCYGQGVLPVTPHKEEE